MKRAVLSAIRFYRRYISGMKKTPTCRFTPTCSEYALQAVELHGVLWGGALALWRVLRCNPLGGSGYDPVPTEKPKWHPIRRKCK